MHMIKTPDLQRICADRGISDAVVAEFAQRHLISTSVARAVLANAKNIAAAEVAIVKMRGHR